MPYRFPRWLRRLLLGEKAAPPPCARHFYGRAGSKKPTSYRCYHCGWVRLPRHTTIVASTTTTIPPLFWTKDYAAGNHPDHTPQSLQ